MELNRQDTIPPIRLPKGWKFTCDSNELASNHHGYHLINEGDTAPIGVNLFAGDYSLLDAAGARMDHLVAVERKSLPNIVSDATQDRDRQEAAFERLTKVTSPAIVIEADWSESGGPYRFGACQARRRKPSRPPSPNAVQGTILAWAMRYRIPTFFAGNRFEGERVTRWILARAALDVVARAKEEAKQSVSA